MTYRKRSTGGGSIKLRYVNEFTDNRGRLRRYFRRPGKPPVPLPTGDKSSPEFLEAYLAALASSAPVEIGKEKRSIPGSISALIAAYYDSHDYKDLAANTRASRRGILEKFRQETGRYRARTLAPHHIVTKLDKLSPGVARNWLVAIRGLMQFAVKTGRCAIDPTDGITPPKVPRKADDDDSEDGHQTWPEEWIAQYEGYWPMGSKERLMLALPLFTAQRRSDVLRMGPGMVKNGVMTLVQKKTKRRISIPIESKLAEIIAATLTGEMVYLVTNRKGSYSGSALGTAFRNACDKAGLPKEATMHGLRKAWCRRAAEEGMSEDLMMSITGHETSKELRKSYLQKVNQEKLAHQAIAIMSRRIPR